MQSARNSSMMLEEAYSKGVAILTKYADQRDRLKVSSICTIDFLIVLAIFFFPLFDKAR